MKYSCTSCIRHFKTDEALKQHERCSPMHTKAFHCDPCNHSFSCEKTLAKHKRHCPFAQTPRQDTVKNFSGHNSEMDALRSALARVSILSMPALAVQRHARIPILENPVATMATTTAGTASSKKSKKSPPQRTRETKEFFKFPELHAEVQQAVLPEVTSTWFNPNEDDGSKHTYYTHVMGKFTCNNDSCKKQVWTSKKVPIEIKGYRKNGYGATVYNQRCKACDSLGTFELNKQSYVERVSYRIKKWAGVKMEEVYRGRTELDKPHERAFCEGCKRGKCWEGDHSAL